MSKAIRRSFLGGAAGYETTNIATHFIGVLKVRILQRQHHGDSNFSFLICTVHSTCMTKLENVVSSLAQAMHEVHTDKQAT